MEKQSELEISVPPSNSDNKIERYIKNPVSLVFFYDLQIFSFIIANVAITQILNYYFHLDLLTYLLILCSGTLFSLIIIKTHYFLDIHSAYTRIKNLVKYLGKIIGNSIHKTTRSQDIQLPRVKVREFVGFTCRNIFFNLLNDSFIVLIYWITLFTLLTWLCITKIPTPFSDFADSMAVIGIISGLFQLYIKDYKENSNTLIKSIIEEKLNILRTISLKDFEIFLIQKNKDQFVKAIQNIIGHKDVLSQDILEGYKVLGRERWAILTQNIYTSRIIDSNSINGFIELESYVDRDKSFNKRELHYQYEDYFKTKRMVFRSNITEKNIADLRKILFSMIIFSDEITQSLIKISVGIPKKRDTIETFSEYFLNFQRECIYDLLYMILINKRIIDL